MSLGTAEPEPTEAELNAAIDRLTRAMATAGDEDVLDLVAERKDLRARLAKLRADAAGVPRLDVARARRSK